MHFHFAPLNIIDLTLKTDLPKLNITLLTNCQLTAIYKHCLLAWTEGQIADTA